jgi:ADP-ribosylarginine hydrolase
MEFIKASLLLHALGDTIGFKNGDWEFNMNNLEIEMYNSKTPKLVSTGRIDASMTIDILYEFIELGGINKINLKGWKVSDDTLFHLATCKALVDDYSVDVLTLGEQCFDNYQDVIKEVDFIVTRRPGYTTMRNLTNRKKTVLPWNELRYDINYGGNGGAMRCPCIGLAFWKEPERIKLVASAIEACRSTHNSATGYLGGITSALFTSLAINKVEIEKWPYILVELLMSDMIPKYLKETQGLKEFLRDRHEFINGWRTYIEYRYDNKKVKYVKAFRHNAYRISVFMELFSRNKKDISLVGSSGDDCVILAYDSLLMAKDNWEKLVTYAMLHVGDSDTVGCIAGAWYGAMYGLKNVNEMNLKYLEKKAKILELSDKVFKEFHE